MPGVTCGLVETKLHYFLTFGSRRHERSASRSYRLAPEQYLIRIRQATGCCPVPIQTEWCGWKYLLCWE